MSHTVTIKAEIRSEAAVRAACQRLGLPAPIQGEVRLFSGKVTGLAIQLTDWRYPAVADTATGQLQFDHFQGRWGDPVHLDRFLQIYAVECARGEARKRGHSCTEATMADGSIQLTIQVNGGAPR